MKKTKYCCDRFEKAVKKKEINPCDMESPGSRQGRNAVSRGRSRSLREPPAPAGGGSTSAPKDDIVAWYMGKLRLSFCPFCGAPAGVDIQATNVPVQRADVKKKIKKKKRPGVDEDGRNELHRAILMNDIARVQQLVTSKKIDVNEQDDEGFSALHLAAQENRKDIVRILLDHGAVVDIRDNNGNTPLTRSLDSCYESLTTNMPDPGAIIKMLLQAGADPNSQNNYGVKIIDTVKWGGPNVNIKQFFNKKNWK